MKIIEKDEEGHKYSDYSDNEYFNEIDALSNSNLKLFLKSPGHLVTHVQESKIAFLLGHAVEDYLYQTVLKDGRFDKKFFIETEGYSRPSNWEEIVYSENPLDFLKYKKGGDLSSTSTNDWIKAAAENLYKIPLKESEFNDVKGMVESLLKMDIKIYHHGKEYGPIKLDTIISSATIEEPIVWEDDQGLIKRAKPDLISEMSDFIFLPDFKTYRDSPKTFNKQANGLRYDLQACHYHEAVEVKYGGDVTLMHFIVVEKTLPYVSGILTFKDEQNYFISEEIYFEGCRKYQRWVESGKPLTTQMDGVGEIFIWGNRE